MGAKHISEKSKDSKTEHVAEHHAKHAEHAVSRTASESKSGNNTLLYVMIFLSIGLIIFNQFQINVLAAGVSPSSALASSSTTLTGNAEQDAIALILAKGVPPIYGTELGVSFDDPVASMDIMKNFDPTYGSQKIVLQGAELDRYIKIGTVPSIACEYC